MPTNYFAVPPAQNEPVLTYKPDSPERIALKKALAKAQEQEINLPMIIDGQAIESGDRIRICPPHDKKHTLGYYHQGNAGHVKQAIDAALHAKADWEAMPCKSRAAIFLKAAELIAGQYRAKINAATMLAQSKNVFQAEIDSACELADFYRYNVEYMTEIYDNQPDSSHNEWNMVEQRPLEGFIFALTPFNFTSIAGNLPTAPALMGNTVVWKPSKNQIYSAAIIMEILQAAGLPDGVINMVFAPGPLAGEVIFQHPDFAGFHFTGSTEVFQSIWKTIGQNIDKYKTYPRIVGETGGKNYILMHESASARQVATAITRGAFEYQGQKCSAVARVYIPRHRWNEIRALLMNDIADIKIGTPEDFRNFMNAVIDQTAYEKIMGFIERAKQNPSVKVIAGGQGEDSKGWFIEPTILLTTDPKSETMTEEIFGPVVTIYLYESHKFEQTLDLIDNTSVYGLTGAIFARQRDVIDKVSRHLKHTAGNFYINDKPTGAVVNRQPFGGARASGTNDKAGSMINLLRWVSPRAIKENFYPPEDFRYPFMAEE